MSILHKLFLLLAGLVFLPLATVTLVLFQNARGVKGDLTALIDSAGAQVADKSAAALTRQVELTHSRIIQEKASRLETYFETIRGAVLLQSTLIRECLLEDPPARPPYPLYTDEQVNLLKATDAVFRDQVFGKAPYAMHHLRQGLSPESAGDVLRRLQGLGGFLAHTFRQVPGCATAYLGHRDGITFGYPGGSRFSPDYDPRLRPWYLAAQRRRGVIWTRAYLDRGDSGLVITCAAPVLADDGSVLAVAAMDVRLAELIRELFALGGLAASEALLIDDAGRVRVSATYVDGATRFDPRTALEAPLAEAFHDPGLRAAVRDIARQGLAGGIVQPQAGSEGSLYAFAAVRLAQAPAADEPPPAGGLGVDPGAGPGGAGVWRYVVKVPLAPVIRPAQDIRADVRGVTGRMRATIEGEVARMGWAVGGIAAAAMSLALLLAWHFAGRATRPLVQMELVAQRIAVGDFDQQVDARSGDEVGRLGRAVNQMVAGLRERDFIKGTFKRYVSASVVDELIRDPAKVRLGGEKKDLVVFFSDLQGFTPFAESLPPETVVALLNEYLGAMTVALVAQDGTLDKYVGDAILAFWGAPLARPDDALRACQTALQHRRDMGRLAADWARRGLPALDVRIGIAGGPAIVGNIGSERLMSYTVIGDTVNTCSRIEGVNKAYGTHILIGDSVRRAAGDAVAAREVDLVGLQGKSAAVRVHELVGLAGDVGPAMLAGLRAYEAALAHHRGRRWDHAEAGFLAAIAALGDDGPSRVLLARNAAYRAAPPPAGWDGSFAMPGK